MELAVMSPVLNNMGLESAIKYLSELGVDSMELGVGGYPGKALCDAGDYLAHPEKIEALKELLKKYNVSICALSAHGNPIHPNKEIAKAFESDFDNAVLLAEKLGIDTIIGFSGCAGDCEDSKNPNWVTCAWPPVYQEELEYQWNECLLPYWEKAAKDAENAGVKIAIEMHPGFCVYNTETMLRLREEIGPVMGANFDPSHLFWQGMDAAAAIRKLGNAIHYVHAKDCKVDEETVRKAGVLDTKNLGLVQERSWIFRTVGYGHDETTWKNIISQLKAIGYDGTISIEHEDALMSVKEGAEKAIEFLKKIIIREQNSGTWWT